MLHKLGSTLNSFTIKLTLSIEILSVSYINMNILIIKNPKKNETPRYKI
jgi:hypothetical protein